MHRMGSCVGKTYGEIWTMFLAAYQDVYNEDDLRRIHVKWRSNFGALFNGKAKDKRKPRVRS